MLTLPKLEAIYARCIVVHSGHQLGLDSAVDQRLLPLFWALDYFKSVPESERQTKQMRAVADNLPELRNPIQLLEQGCVEFDAERHERSLVTLIRTRGASAVAEPAPAIRRPTAWLAMRFPKARETILTVELRTCN